MAFNYENPHNDPNLGNYDYYVQEVKEFNRKLDEYQEEVNQKLADQDSEIADFKLNVNNQIGTLRIQLADFEREINQTFSSWTEEQTRIFNEELAAFRTEVRSISENVESYVAEHMNEWQVEASTITFTAHTVSSLSYSNITCDKTYDEIVALLSEPAVDIVFTYTGRTFKVNSISRKTTSIIFTFRGYTDYLTSEIDCTFTVEIDTSENITCIVSDVLRPMTIHATTAVNQHYEGDITFSAPKHPTILSITKIGTNSEGININLTPDDFYTPSYIITDNQDNTYSVLLRSSSSADYKIIVHY